MGYGAIGVMRGMAIWVMSGSTVVYKLVSAYPDPTAQRKLVGC
jgi:hypothetical protein